MVKAHVQSAVTGHVTLKEKDRLLIGYWLADNHSGVQSVSNSKVGHRTRFLIGRGLVNAEKGATVVRV